MAEPRIHPKGIRVFSPRDGAPSFVKGSVVITPNELVSWLKENQNLLSEYRDQKQLRLDLLDGKDGMYLVVNNFQPKGKSPSSDLPF